MSMRRRFHGKPARRLIVSVPVVTVAVIDALIDRSSMGKRHPAKGCRSEFIRIAITEKLERDRLAMVPGV